MTLTKTSLRTTGLEYSYSPVYEIVLILRVRRSSSNWLSAFYQQLSSYMDQMAEKQPYPNLLVLDLADPKPGSARPAAAPSGSDESSQAQLFDSISRLPFCLKVLCDFDGVCNPSFHKLQLTLLVSNSSDQLIIYS